MIKKLAKKAGKLVKDGVSTAGDVVGASMEQAGAEKSAQWVREAARGVGAASGANIALAGKVVEGTYNTAKGQYDQDLGKRDAGVDELKDSAKTVGRSIVALVKNTSSSVYDTSVGLATKDYERMRAGLWKGSQIAIVAVAAVGVVDFIDGGDVVFAESINDHYRTSERESPSL